MTPIALVPLLLTLWTAPGGVASPVATPSSGASSAGAPSDLTQSATISRDLLIDRLCAGDQPLSPCGSLLATELRSCHRRLAARSQAAIGQVVSPAPAPTVSASLGPSAFELGLALGLVGLLVGVALGAVVTHL